MDASVETDREAYLADLKQRIAAAWPEDMPRDPVYPFGQICVPDYLRAWSDRKGDETAIDFYGYPVSWADLDRLSDAFASFLATRDVGPGDRVAVFMPNCPQFSITFFGILKRGAILVPVNPMVTGRELSHYLEDSGASLVVALDKLAPLVKEVDHDNALTFQPIQRILSRPARLMSPSMFTE